MSIAAQLPALSNEVLGYIGLFFVAAPFIAVLGFAAIMIYEMAVGAPKRQRRYEEWVRQKKHNSIFR